MGQKSDMEKAFGNKIRLLPKRLSDLNSATKYESRIIIQESDGEIANTATKNLVKKLQKKYNKEDIVVIKRLWHQSNASVWIRVLISRICVCIVY
jgi:hypothetical protein